MMMIGSKKKIALLTDTGKEFSVKVGCFDTVLEMKEMIREKRGYLVIDQTLCFNGETLPDDFNAYYATHIDGPIFVIVDRHRETREGRFPNLSYTNLFEITLQSPLRVTVNGMNTVAQLKTQIPGKIESMATIPVSRIVLKHKGVELRDSSKTLHECGIAADSVLNVGVRNKLDLLVKMPDDSKVISVQMYATDKVWQLKMKIKELPEGKFLEAGIRPIFLGEKELADHRRLVDCAIPSNQALSFNSALPLQAPSPAPPLAPGLSSSLVRQSPASAPAGPSTSPKRQKLIASENVN